MQGEKFTGATVINDNTSKVKTYSEQQVQKIKIHYERQINKLKLKAIDYENKYLYAKEQLDLLLYKKYTRSAEQINDDKQQHLFAEETEKVEIAREESEDETTEVKAYSRKKCGRKAIDPLIRREERIIDIPEDEKTCACGADLTRIGEETSEKLQIIPMRVYVDKIIRPKYACRKCEGTEDENKPVVRIAPLEPSMIPRSISTPSLLSTIFTHKFEDHLPYYRQEKQFERIGVDISRQDMSNWQQQVYTSLTPLFDLLVATLKSGPVIQMDETTIQVMGEQDRKDTQKSYMWLARGGPPFKKAVWYEYRTTRAGKHAREFLEGYSGYLQTDGYEGYDMAVKDMPLIVHVGCFAHARRKFFEASQTTKKPQ